VHRLFSGMIARPERASAAARIVELTTALAGLALVGAAIAATQPWLDRHFLPSFFLPRPWYVLIETIVRLAIGSVGVVMVLTRRRLAGAMIRGAVMMAMIVVAAGLALAAGEIALRMVHLRSTEWLVADEEPRRQPDPQLGWVLAPDRTGRASVDGRAIEYAIDRQGYRVQHADGPVDLARPVVVFAGESVMFGEGLAWEESIPAQTGAMLGMPVADIAVHGYSTDQIYMRLARELPHFRQPAAVISIFMTELFGRNLDDDRPYLAPGLVWHPAQHAPRLAALAGLLVPYRRDTTVEQGVRMTREVLRATMDLARARRAPALVVVPQFGPEDAAQQALRERVLGPEIPQLIVQLDPGWRLPWDRHPNARAAHVIATAIAARLHPR
jgi:hypothetical protein